MEFRIFEHGVVDSTSDRAFAALAEGSARHGDVHVATGQTAGRGRRGSRWVRWRILGVAPFNQSHQLTSDLIRRGVGRLAIGVWSSFGSFSGVRCEKQSSSFVHGFSDGG